VFPEAFTVSRADERLLHVADRPRDVHARLKSTPMQRDDTPPEQVTLHDVALRGCVGAAVTVPIPAQFGRQRRKLGHFCHASRRSGVNRPQRKP